MKVRKKLQKLFDDRQELLEEIGELEWKIKSNKNDVERKEEDISNLKSELSHEDLSRMVLYDINLSSSDLKRVNFEFSILWGTNLSNCNLKYSNLRKTNLKKANLEGANLEGADLMGSDLEGANLKNTNLGGANLEGANLKDTILDNAGRSSRLENGYVS